MSEGTPEQPSSPENENTPPESTPPNGDKNPQESGGCGLTCLVLIGYLAFFAFAIAMAVVLVNMARA